MMENHVVVVGYAALAVAAGYAIFYLVKRISLLLAFLVLLFCKFD